MAQINWGEDIQNFFNNDLAKMVSNLFKFPTTCLNKFNEDCKVKTVVLPLMTLVVGYIITTLMFLIMGMPNFGYSLEMALLLPFFIVFLCILTFVVMAAKGKSDIGLALQHTAIHSLIFTLAFVVVALFVLISGDGLRALYNIFDSGFWAVFIILVIVYALALGISCVRQLMNTLDGEGKEAFAWWISPCVVVVSLALAIFIGTKLL